MNAVWQLWLQMWRRMPVLVVLVALMWLAGMGLSGTLGKRSPDLMAAGIPLILGGAWFWSMSRGQQLLDLCRAENFLLPGFRRSLLGLAALDGIVWMVLPALMTAALGMPHALLVATGLLLAAAVGLASGTGRRAGLLIWLIFILAGWMPKLFGQLAMAALHSPLTPLLLVLVAALILRLVLRPLLTISDIGPDSSPLESTGLDRMNATPAGGAPPRGTIGKRIAALFDRTSQRAMEQALARYRQRPGGMQRLALLRSLLLPHDNPAAIAMRLLMVAAMVTLYFVVLQHRPHYNAAVIGAYAVLLSLSRFPQLGRGMQRMRPNLADLYLTLAPATRSEYQKSLADALLILVPVSVISALAYTVLGIVLVHAAEPGRMLLTAAIVVTAASLAALAVHLIGPEGNVGRAMVNIVLLLGAMGSYWGGYVLLGALGLTLGGALLALVTISFGFGAWFASQREYQRREPCFDAPAG